MLMQDLDDATKYGETTKNSLDKLSDKLKTHGDKITTLGKEKENHKKDLQDIKSWQRRKRWLV